MFTFFCRDQLMAILQCSRFCVGILFSAAAAVSKGSCYLNYYPKMSTNLETSSSKYESGTHSVAYVTAPNEEVAKTIARGLVTNKLAACVNLIPKITSIYEWKDKIEEDSEVLMMIKTRTTRVEDLTKFVRENHPYEICEVITLPIANGNPPYLQWIGDIVKEKN